MSKLTTAIRLEWEKVDSDGSECIGCGNVCYSMFTFGRNLFMWKAIAVVNGKSVPLVDRDRDYAEYIICGNCHESLLENA